MNSSFPSTGRPACSASTVSSRRWRGRSAGQAGRRAWGTSRPAGGALPGALSRDVRDLRERDLLCAHVTAARPTAARPRPSPPRAPCHHGLHDAGWDLALCGPRPGDPCSASALGHGGMAALDTAHAAIALGCRNRGRRPDVVRDPRPRHRGISHHTMTVLGLLLSPVVVACRGRRSGSCPTTTATRFVACRSTWRLSRQRPAGRPTMGRDLTRTRTSRRRAGRPGRTLGRWRGPSPSSGSTAARCGGQDHDGPGRPLRYADGEVV